MPFFSYKHTSCLAASCHLSGWLDEADSILSAGQQRQQELVLAFGKALPSLFPSM